VGGIRFLVVTGNTNTDANEADVKTIFSMTDIRNNPSLSDFTGQLQVEVPLQITDSYNADENPEMGTAQSVNLQIPVNCTATADTSIGGACSINSTMNAIIPGAVLENKRNNWQLGQVTVKDPNGSVFLRQGLWVP
jgi:hypothetical protein